MPALRRLALLLIALHCAFAAQAAPAYIVDGDGDGVSDDIDDCPYTHPGVQVNAKGCPLKQDDSDLDGVPDDEDDCPYTTPGAVIDAKGCALDTDFDGVANGLDRCPHTPLSQVVNALGCASGERMEAVAARPPVRAVAASAATPPARASAPLVSAPPVVAAVRVPSQASQPIVAARTTESTVSPVASGSALETPKLRLRFASGSSRLNTQETALATAYAKVFNKRLAANAGTVLMLKAYADRREPDAATAAVARMAAVRQLLVQSGIPLDRIRAENGLLNGGNATDNRHVEAEIVGR